MTPGKLALLALLALAAGCSSGGAVGRPCTDDSMCETGQLCGAAHTCESVLCTRRADCPGASTCLASGFCGPEECASSGDCGDGRVCIDRACFSAEALPACEDGGTCAGGKVCNPQTNRCENCSSTLRCPTGQNCRNGTCESPNIACTSDDACLPTGRVCDRQAQTCVACTAMRPCPASHVCDQGTCRPRPRCGDGGACAPGTSCDSATGYCVATGTVPLCGACAVDAECQGAGSRCLAFATGGSFCGRACSGSNTCPTGYGCDPRSNQCVPLANRCTDNCVLTGCTTGSCDDQTGLCMGPKRLCDSCENDAECGAPTDRCLPAGDGGARICAQDCDTTHVGGRNCPAGFVCRNLEGGIKQCLPQGGECVVDPCANIRCGQPTPFCDPATRTCVECLQDSNCPASDQICTPQKTCIVPGACQNDANCSNDPGGSRCCSTALGMRCKQCCQDAHCSGATPYCVANVCQSQRDPCATVTCPPNQQCNPATGNCEGGGTGGSCRTAADCGGLQCDPQFNFCYDPTGICQDNTQCAPGQTCALFCTGCTATGGYCPPGLLCLFDICIGLSP